MDTPDRVGEIVTAFVADLTGQPLHDLPSPQASGDEWLAVLRLWLARLDCGLVAIANPETFSWPGHWIGIVDAPDEGGHTDRRPALWDAIGRHCEPRRSRPRGQGGR